MVEGKQIEIMYISIEAGPQECGNDIQNQDFELSQNQSVAITNLTQKPSQRMINSTQ